MKNLKLPTTMKIVGVMGFKSLDVYRKRADNEYKQHNALARINFGASILVQVVRTSSTQIIIKSNHSSIMMTLGSAYDRDFFTLLFRKLCANYLKYISKVELREIDFYKRREDYLERQLFRAARELKEKDREMVRLKCEG